MRELEILTKVNHDFIIKAFETIVTDEVTILITKLYECDLLQYVRKNGALREGPGRRIMRELFLAMQYLHEVMDIGNFLHGAIFQPTQKF